MAVDPRFVRRVRDRLRRRSLFINTEVLTEILEVAEDVRKDST